MHLLTLFARSEPTTDPVCLRYLSSARLATATDVQLYYDPNCTKPAARYRFGMTRPHRNSRTVMHNCFRYALQWLPAMVRPTPCPYRFAFGTGALLDGSGAST